MAPCRSHRVVFFQCTAARRDLQKFLGLELRHLISLRRHQLLGADLHWHDHVCRVHLAVRGVPVQGRRWKCVSCAVSDLLNRLVQLRLLLLQVGRLFGVEWESWAL